MSTNDLDPATIEACRAAFVEWLQRVSGWAHDLSHVEDSQVAAIGTNAIAGCACAMACALGAHCEVHGEQYPFPGPPPPDFLFRGRT